METIFDIVYHTLVVLAQMSGFTYKEINIIVYYGLLPLLFVGCLIGCTTFNASKL